MGDLGGGTIDPSCDPTPCPSPRSTLPAALPQAAGMGKIRARLARFFFAALCAARGRRGERPHEFGNEEETISDVQLGLQQVPARAELRLAAALGDIELRAIP